MKKALTTPTPLDSQTQMARVIGHNGYARSHRQSVPKLKAQTMYRELVIVWPTSAIEEIHTEKEGGVGGFCHAYS